MPDDTVVETPSAEPPASEAAPGPDTAAEPAADLSKPAAPDPAVAKVAEAAAERDRIRAKVVADNLKAQTQIRKQREELESQHRELSNARQQMEAASEQLAGYRAEMLKVAQWAKDNPFEFLQDLGIGPDEYWARAQNGGKPSPQERSQDQLRAAYDKISQLEAWQKAQEDRERQGEENYKQRQAQQQQAAYAHEQAQAREEFWAEIEGNAAEYPDLAFYPKAQVIEIAVRSAEQLGDEANGLSYKDLATRLQAGMREWHAEVERRRQPANANPQAVPVSAAAPVVPRDPPAVSKKRLGNTRGGAEATLSSSLNQRGSAKTSPKFDLEQAKRDVQDALDRAKAAP